MFGNFVLNLIKIQLLQRQDFYIFSQATVISTLKALQIEVAVVYFICLVLPESFLCRTRQMTKI
jgi:hypothetical protein